ncbi:MAG: ABC transporter substrate-binding protein [Bacteriovoracaceae bacterium]|jgi:ABC-type transport system substrate-binding protein|nr:ABC transporter substrate-binding protein [Bacteriovoracaceae bacterium]
MFKLSALLLSVFILSACTKKVNLNEKVLNLVVSAKVKGMDPVNAGDTYSSYEIARVYEGLLTYHYLKRPYTLIPNLAQQMPTVSKDGTEYTFKIKKGVMFHDNECFENGKGRELVANDFIYSIKRLADLKNNSNGWWLLDGRIKGLNEWRKAKGNYDQKIEGLTALDSHTLKFTLVKPYPQFLYALAMVYTFAVPKEAVDYYKDQFLNNPVGTGAFMTGTYKQSNRIEYTRNPNYRQETYPTEGTSEDEKLGLLEDAGKKLPLVDKIVINIQTESQPAWLSFEKGKVDILGIPKDNFDQVVTPGKGITDKYAKKGIVLKTNPDLDITYIAFNHEHPLFKSNRKLRQAMSLAYDGAKSNELFYNNNGILAQTILPPGLGGYDKNYKNPYRQFNIAKAKKLLALAGYPEGKGLPTITYDCSASTTARQMGEFFKKNMAAIGINVQVVTNTWPQLVKKVKTKQTQTYGMAWLGDYPDAENFLQLVYGPNKAPGPNGSNYDNQQFNKKFDIVTKMQPGPQRAAKYKELAQSVAEDAVYILGVHRKSFVVKHGWLKNYKFSTFQHGHAKYYDVDIEVKKANLKKL